MVNVRHGDSVSRRENNQCMRCRCNNGEVVNCTRREGDTMCSRSDPDARPANCMMDGEMVMHNEQREASTDSKL